MPEPTPSVIEILDSLLENLEAAHEIITRNGTIVKPEEGVSTQRQLNRSVMSYSLQDAMRLRSRVYAALRNRDLLEVLAKREKQMALF